MTEEEGRALHAENTRLRDENAMLKQLVAELQEQIEGLSRQVAELEKRQKTPSFVKGTGQRKRGQPKNARNGRPGTIRRVGGKSRPGSRRMRSKHAPPVVTT